MKQLVGFCALVIHLLCDHIEGIAYASLPAIANAKARQAGLKSAFGKWVWLVGRKGFSARDDRRV